MIRRGLLASSLALSLAWVVVPSAPAEQGSTLRIGHPVMRDCADAFLSRPAAGTASRFYTAPAGGLLTARLEGDTEPDWDLALFRDDEPAGASTAFGSIEQASIMVEAGDEIAVQACRRDGGRAEVPLSLELDEIPEPSNERVSLESVPIAGPGDVPRLEQLGIDVTHEVSDAAATVVLHSSAERALLASAGFTTSTLIPDLVAADRADRRAESRAAAGERSDLPSQRDTYRVYEDYTSELKALADENPTFVRKVTLGTTFEGRPIEGVEIAADVLREDDGRPVYLNFGAHHAREWPSAEFPMEFARGLVAAFNDVGHPRHARVVSLLENVRTVIVPVVNVDGFIASRSFGTSPLDDDENATLGQAVANQGAYIRKNCRPTGPGDTAIPCAFRTGSGVDLNRNYGYYWGGVGSSTDTTSQGYRGTAPFSEPETQALHEYESTIHPTVYITNHTFTTEGEWLRQPGFKLATLADSNPAPGANNFDPFTEDEVALKDLGDSWAAATGWESNRSYTIGEITGAAEDWNYFAQGSYGYTPEARGPNFHANYANMVVTEYLGDAGHPGLGVAEAFLIGGERAGNEPDHGVISGDAPPGATLKLTKQFDAPTSQAIVVPEALETTLKVGASGQYEWHVNPSNRPDVDSDPGTRTPPAESWTMTCRRPGGTLFTDTIDVARGQTVTKEWGALCGADTGPFNPVADFTISPMAPLVGQQVNFFDASTDADGAIATREWDLDDDGQFDDAIGLVATRRFPAAGTYRVSLQVTDDDGDTDTETKSILVSDPPPVTPAPPAGSAATTARCRKLVPTLVGTTGDDRLRGTPGDDVIAPLAGDDRVFGLGGDDTVCGSLGDDRINGGSGADTLVGNKGDDRIKGGSGRDRLRGGNGDDWISGGAGRDRCKAGSGGGTLRRCP